MTETHPPLAEFRAEFSDWLKQNAPATPNFRLPKTFMEVGTDEQFNFLRDWQAKVHDAGYLGVSWPKAYGGRALPFTFQAAIDSEMVRQRVPIMFNTIGLNWAGPLILEMGTDEAKARYLKGILSGEDVWCQGFSEPGAGSDLANIRTTAVRDGNEWLINGSKIWTTLGDRAKYMILLAQGDLSAPRYKGMNFLLIPMDAPGIEVHRIQKMTGEYGFCQVFFNDVRVPADCLIGEELGGWHVAMRTLMYERGAESGQAGRHQGTGLDSNTALDVARKAQRDGHPALEDPVIRDELVSLLIEERVNLLHSKRMRHRALRGDYPAAVALSGKWRGSEWDRRWNKLAAELQGVDGALYLGDPDALDDAYVQRAYLNSFSATIGGGPTQIQANIIAERVLGLPKD